MQRGFRIALVFLIMLAAVAQAFFVGLTNDTDLLLHTTAHAIYNGGLYTSWITVNSPPIYAIYTIPALLSASFGMHPAIALHEWTAACCFGSLCFIRRLLQKQGLPEMEQRIWLAACATALFILPGIFHTFADREHYLFIFALPWIMCMLLRFEPPGATIALAMLGLIIKPYNLLLLPALIFTGGPAAGTLRQRVFSASTGIATALLAGYLLIVFLCFPAYLHILSVALVAYSAVGFSLDTRIGEAEPFLALMIVAIAGIRPVWRGPFLALTVAAAAIYCLNAGWIYIAYVMSVPAVLLAAALWLSPHPVRERCYAKAIAAVIAAAALILGTFNIGRDAYDTATSGYARGHTHFPVSLVQKLRLEAGGDFILFSYNLWSSAVGELKSPYQALFPYDDWAWPLAWVSHHIHDPRADTIWLEMLCKPLVNAIRDNNYPAFISDDSPGQRLNMYNVFLQDEVFRQATTGYVKTGTLDVCTPTRNLECRFTFWHKPQASLLSH